MRTLALLLEYDGTNYSGWQFQRNAASVQQVLEKALEKLTGKKTRVAGSGRTDAGVHAAGQVCSFKASAKLPLTAFSPGLNAHLPPDVRVLAAREVPAGFDARRAAERKCYVYRIVNRPAPTALARNRAWHVPMELDWTRIRRACRMLVGEHDFAAFQAAGAATKTTVREIESVTVRRKGPLYVLTFVGSGFLRGQVRSMTGTLAAVGRGKLPEERIEELLRRPDRAGVGPTAPACGLCLEWVDYGPSAGLPSPWTAPGGALPAAS